MSIGGLKEVDALTHEEWVAYRDLALEAIEAWDHGEEMHVSGTTKADLGELVMYAGAQVQRLEEGLAVVGIKWPLRSLMRAMRPAVDARLSSPD
jgi:hypothetical protein